MTREASARRQRMTGAERREQLLDIAEEILLKEGQAALNIARLADDAGVARTVVYSHFTDVSDIVRQVLERHWQALAEDFPRRLQDETVETSLRRLATFFLDSGPRMRRLQRLLSATARDPVAGPMTRSRQESRQERWARRLIVSAGVSEDDAPILSAMMMASLGALARLDFANRSAREHTVEVFVQATLAAIERMGYRPDAQ